MSYDEFDELYKKYSKDLYRFIYSMAYRNKYDAEDIMQDTMLLAYKSYKEIRSKEAAKSWLFTIARNETGRYYSNKSKKVIHNSIDIDSAGIQEDENIKEPDFSIKYINDEILKCTFSELNDIQQRIVILRFKYGLTTREISETWGINHTTIRTISRRALKRLNDELTKKGFEC